MSGHTKGPWVARRMHTGGFDIMDPRDRDVVTVYGGGVEIESLEANARLIAAAPDLLEAAQWAEKALERYSDALGLSVDEAALIALTKISAAIARADGGE